MEYSILILLVALVFLIRGGGDYSVDRRWQRNSDAAAPGLGRAASSQDPS